MYDVRLGQIAIITLPISTDNIDHGINRITSKPMRMTCVYFNHSKYHRTEISNGYFKSVEWYGCFDVKGRGEIDTSVKPLLISLMWYIE